jgi:hypothetical protein
MPDEEFPWSEPDGAGDRSVVDCEACQSVIDDESDRTVSFLLLDHLTIPVRSCERHLERFSTICGLTTEDSARVLDHYPAGGVACPACRNARYDTSRPMVSVDGGMVVITACPDHQSQILQRFDTGLETHQQLTASLGGHDTL